MNENLETLAHLKNTLINHAVAFGPKLLVALAMMAAGVFAARSVGKVASRGLERFDLEPPVRDLLVRAVRGVVLALFAVMALQNLGVELLPLIAGLGVAGAGIALALQGVLGNAAAGLTLIFTKPFRVGEYIAIVGVEGLVDSINLFSTTLTHADRSRVVIPNRKLVGEILHNFGKVRRVEVTLGVSYGADLGAALALAREVVAAHPKVLKDPEPAVAVAKLADASIQLSVTAFASVLDAGGVGGDLNRSLAEAFRARGIPAPVPLREVRMLG